LLAQFLRKALILRLYAYYAPFYLCWYSGAENFLNQSGLCLQDDEPVSPTSQNGTMEDVITTTTVRESGDEFIEVIVEEPQKIGDGMNSYLAYK
jgi:hypothetical protein